MARKTPAEWAVGAEALLAQKLMDVQAAEDQVRAYARILARETLKSSGRDLSGLRAALRGAISHLAYEQAFAQGVGDVAVEMQSLAESLDNES